jgi:DNA-binding NarL/FixJ family response regulator
MMITGQLYLLFVGSIALLALLIGFWQLRVSGKMGRELVKLRRELLERETQQELKPSFSNSLDQVEREQKTAGIPRSSSEKYRYVASLAGQGVNAQEIAVALQMAPAEVEQLLKLVRVKK